MMKAIWRHIRLKKGFVNVEPLSQGGHKLKIPQLLLMEKKRTQQRFNIMRKNSSKIGPRKDRRSTSILSRKVDMVLHNIILPLSRSMDHVPKITVLAFKQEDYIKDILLDVQRNYPTLFKDKKHFIRSLKATYKEICSKNT